MAEPKQPLYQVIFGTYEKKILSGTLAPGDKLPTEMEIAAEFGVSRITATRALKELELRAYIRRVQGSGSYVNNRDWEAAEASRTGRLSIISLVLPFGGTASFEMLKGVEDVARERDYFVTFHNSSHDPTVERRTIEDIVARGSHGVILYPTFIGENMDLYSGLLIDTYPFVLIDHRLPGLEMPFVSADNRRGFYDVTCHLFDLGHQRIVMAASDVLSVSSEKERYDGFCRAHLDRGIPLRQEHLYGRKDLASAPADYRPDQSPERRGIHYLFDRFQALPSEDRPTAIAAVNDAVAREILAVALERGISVPRDISVSGFDDLPFAAHLSVPLTTVAQPMEEIGRTAAEELFNSIGTPGGEPTERRVPCPLIIRESTAACIRSG